MPWAFDDKALLERVDNDWDFLAETVEMLQTDGRALMEKTRAAVDAADAAALALAAHTLKGMISNFCSRTAQASALELAKIGKSGDLAAAPASVSTLQAQLDALIASLNEFLATRPV